MSKTVLILLLFNQKENTKPEPVSCAHGMQIRFYKFNQEKRMWYIHLEVEIFEPPLFIFLFKKWHVFLPLFWFANSSCVCMCALKSLRVKINQWENRAKRKEEEKKLMYNLCFIQSVCARIHVCLLLQLWALVLFVRREIEKLETACIAICDVSHNNKCSISSQQKQQPTIVVHVIRSAVCDLRVSHSLIFR